MTRTRLVLAAALFVLPSLAVAAPANRAAPVSYAAPAGGMPAGHLRGATFDAVLPSGRLVTPAGENVVTGIDALLTPAAFGEAPLGMLAFAGVLDAGG